MVDESRPCLLATKRTRLIDSFRSKFFAKAIFRATFEGYTLAFHYRNQNFVLISSDGISLFFHGGC